MTAELTSHPVAQPHRDGALADRVIECAAVFLVATGLIGAALALAGQFSAVAVTALAGLAAWGWDRARGDPGPVNAPPHGAFRWRHAIPILLLALWFRAPGFDVVLGGQDPGVYAAMGAHIDRTGGVAVHDRVLARMPAGAAANRYLADNHGGSFVPGVYSEGGGQMRFQFYPLFPALLATATGLGGAAAVPWFLVLLGLAGVLAVQRTAIALTGNAGAGIAAGLLLACNPLHAYVSRAPLTEPAALLFALIGAGALARYALAPPERRARRWLVLSTLGFSALFLTRISGFLLLPLVIGLPVASALIDPDRLRARGLGAWGLATLAAFVASVCVGLAWSRPYAMSIYSQGFGASSPAAVLVAMALLLAIGLGAWAWAWHAAPDARSRGFARDAMTQLPRLAAGLLGIALLLMAWRAWQLGYTSRFAGDDRLTQFPGLVGNGWRSGLHASLSAFALATGPLALVGAWAIAARRDSPVAGRLLAALTALIVLYLATSNWVLPYLPYYGRYLVSELVPLTCLVLACAWAWLPPGRARRNLAIVLAVTLAWGAAWSALQAGGREQDGARASVARLAALADAGDLIAIEHAPAEGLVHMELKTALLYAFGRDVASLGPGALDDAAYLRALDAAWDDVFVVTMGAAGPAGSVPVDSIRLRSSRFRRGAFPAAGREPELDAEVHVHRLVAAGMQSGHVLAYDARDDVRVLSVVGRRSAAGIATTGREGYLLYGPYVSLPPGRYRLAFDARWQPGDEGVLVDVSVGGGTRILASRRIVPPEPFDEPIDFEIPRGAGKAEVRMHVDVGTHLQVRGYTITRRP
jgi:4-amino-4-deoxy-L-arabinose transferase-like glycosyltransferase